MINNVTLTGRLTKDMELKYTTSGTAVASATVAVERSFTDGIGLEGRLQTRSYDNQQGQKVFVTEVVVNNFSLLESKEVTDQRKQGGASQPQQNNFNQQPPQQNNFNQQQAPQGNFNQQRQQPQQNNFGGSQVYGNGNNFEDQLPF